ncbi:unnamed protein product [Parascedosporium putredinis]|uniref:protein-tyrosine-phosphatase n=1 Tax=Parascedosporium putredinis TaxID=1442378 RepID=A0A9P1GWX7_9PEZI|nr:unnamed protein product [Parascedosporium putredinis]CAI7989255.1 unnamed protein product [Parascedosporium putredinis]
MSVFDLDAETMADQETVTVVNPKFIAVESSCATLSKAPLSEQGPTLRTGTVPSDPLHKHHDSTSTQASESADSSPTTTLSTADSSPLSDPSPSSSPDSPVNLIPLSSYPGPSFGGLGLPHAYHTHRHRFWQRVRTAHDLAVAKARAQHEGPFYPTSHHLLDASVRAGITLYYFYKAQNSSHEEARALKHSASTPHMLTGLKSSTFGPSGGMTFPKVLERNENGLSEVLRPTKLTICGPLNPPIAEEHSPIRTQMANRGVIDLAHLKDESENNEDQKSPGYPEGPIAIYEDNVFLYLEPTAEEASKFDLVINVAREVNNPFTTQAAKEDDDVKMVMDLAPAPVDNSPYPDTALTEASFRTAFEFPLGRHDPTPKEPEYVHMLWDHNTDISPDLMPLCERIEKTTKEGKRVLIHCQQGASRSASLIIAYGLYRNPELSVNDAYYAAQARSRWISPNMRLMYCLQDFHKEMSKKKLSPNSALRQRSGRSPTKHRLTLSADAIDMSATTSPTPLTAPLPGEDVEQNALSPGKCSMRQRGNSTPAYGYLKPPPTPGFGGFNTGFGGGFGDSFAPRSFDSHGAFGFSGLSFNRPVDGRPALSLFPENSSAPRERMQFVESPPTPTEDGLFSPRQTMFPRDPFSPFGRPPQVADPRSPPTKGETPIVRSIDEIL